MLSSWKLIAPAETEEADAIKTVLPLPYGILCQIDIIVPPGSWATAHLRLMRALHQIVPYNIESWISPYTIHLTFPEFLYLKEPPRQVEAYVWNDAPTWDHAFLVYLTVLPPIAFPQLGPGWENQIPTVTENGIIPPEE